MAHPEALAAGARYAELARRRFGDRLVGVYVIGSGALGDFAPHRSDVDLIVTLDGRDDGDHAAIRRLQLESGARTTARALARGRSPLAGTCNTAFVDAAELTRPVRAIEPIGSHVGHEVIRDAAFDVNPVQWRTLVDHGVAVVGPAPADLDLDPEPDALVAWNHRNLHDYWRPLAERVRAGGRPVALASMRTGLHWAVLGPLRLHATITTDRVVSKRGAGEHGLEAMEPRWHPLITAALHALAGHRVAGVTAGQTELRRQIGEFGLAVIGDVDARLGGPPAA